MEKEDIELISRVLSGVRVDIGRGEVPDAMNALDLTMFRFYYNIREMDKNFDKDKFFTACGYIEKDM